MIVTYPVGILVDDSGALLTAPVVTIASVLTKAGAAVSSPGATVNGSGTSTPISVDYDAQAHGEAWVILSVSQSGKTVTGANATVARYCSNDSTSLALLLALGGQNSAVRNEAYDAAGNLTGADLCAYDTAAHATLNDGATGLVHKWTLTIAYAAGRQATQSIAQVS